MKGAYSNDLSVILHPANGRVLGQLTKSANKEAAARCETTVFVAQ